MNRNKKVIIGAVVGAAVAVTAGGVAYGAIPGTTDNSVTACVTSSSGAVRIIDVDAGQTCQATEKKVSWGGGMRFIGVWKDGSGPGVPPKWPSNTPSGYPDVKKGDVVRMEVPSNKFGCTTPKGAWVNVVGSYSYPCLEYPQNWAPLALDGATGAAGKNADVHWASFNAQGQLISSSEPLSYHYVSISAGYAYLQFPNLDLTKCGLEVSRNSYTPEAAQISVQSSYNYVLVSSFKANGYYGALGAITVSATCVHY